VLSRLYAAHSARCLTRVLPCCPVHSGQYTAFSLACEEGLCDIAELLIEKGANTSIPNHVGETGMDMARGQAKHRPHEPRRMELMGMLERWAGKDGHRLQREQQRNRSRPVHEVARERPEVDFGRVGFWDRESEEGALKHSELRAEGAYGYVTSMNMDIPVRDSSGKLHYKVVAKSTKPSTSSGSSGGSGSAATKTGSTQSAQADAEVKALANEIKTLHKLDRQSQHPHHHSARRICCMIWLSDLIVACCLDQMRTSFTRSVSLLVGRRRTQTRATCCCLR
jgi:hypothetical protein